MGTSQRTLPVLALLATVVTTGAVHADGVARPSRAAALRANLLFHGLRLTNPDFRTQFGTEKRLAGVSRVRLGLRFAEGAAGFAGATAGGFVAVVGNALKDDPFTAIGVFLVGGGGFVLGHAARQILEITRPAKRGTVRSMWKELSPRQQRVFHEAGWIEDGE